FSARRDLREKAFNAWIARGDGGGATDNKAIIAEMVALREERARLVGYASFADYRLDDTMAKTAHAVRSLLDRVWAPARRRALERGPGRGRGLWRMPAGGRRGCRRRERLSGGRLGQGPCAGRACPRPAVPSMNRNSVRISTSSKSAGPPSTPRSACSV